METFFSLMLSGSIAVLTMMVVLWLVSILIRNASIVDIFWGFGFVVLSWVWFLMAEGNSDRKLLVLVLVNLWGLRLSVYIAWRNHGKGEDYRYQKFRQDYGPKRYWWVSFFQVFMLQGILMILISAPLLGSMMYSSHSMGFIDVIGVIVWLIGFSFEAGGDFQLARFKSNDLNKGKLLNTGFWKYTRHPNYFGDSAVWWGYAVICLAGGSFIPIYGSVMMTLLIINVSGVALLEKTLKTSKPGYEEYVRKTSAFFPWFPEK